MRSAAKKRYDARHRDEINAKKAAARAGAVSEPRPPFDDLELSPWTASLLRRHLSDDQLERMRGVLARRVDDWLARRETRQDARETVRGVQSAEQGLTRRAGQITPRKRAAGGGS